MRAWAIHISSSMAWSRGAGHVGGPYDGVGSEQRDKRGGKTVACGRWDFGGQAFE
jgi:hypothetical protein